MVQTLHTQTEISLPPSEVRKLVRPHPFPAPPPSLPHKTNEPQFLNFKTFPRFTSGFRAKHLEPRDDIRVGDQLEINIRGTTSRPIVLENSERNFYWQGSFWGLLKAKHMWRFLDSEDAGNRGGTTFVQAEEFEGASSPLFGTSWPGYVGGKRGDILKEMENFNADFKKWAESGKVAEEED